MDDELTIRRFLERYELLCYEHGIMIGGQDEEDSLNIRLWALCLGHEKGAVEAAMAVLRLKASEGSEDATGEFDE